MARVKGCEAVYEVADQWRTRCLADTKSLLWPEEDAWKERNLVDIRSAFIDRPDTSSESFFDKWQRQLLGQSDGAFRAAVDALAVYQLFPTNMSSIVKLTNVENLLAWRSLGPPQIEKLRAAFEQGVGNTGPQYMTGRPWQIAFYLSFAIELKANDVSSGNHVECERIADSVLEEFPNAISSRNALLHILFPDRYERIASNRHKEQIKSAFAHILPSSTISLDDALLIIRETLQAEPNRDDFDFYDPDIKPHWSPSSTEIGSESPQVTATDMRNRIWIEKTNVLGREDRSIGEYAVGNALWSPSRSANGANIYRFMRDLQPGDIVLHLTDKTAITGRSVVASKYQEFDCVPHAEWHRPPCYLVRLTNYQELNPPLTREDIFQGSAREGLLQLLNSGISNLFFELKKNGSLSLRQGTYITPVPDALAEILEATYRSKTGQPLVGFSTSLRESQAHYGISEAPTLKHLASRILMSLDETREIEALSRYKQQLIFEGPPGSGKTYVADLVARYLTGNSLDPKVDHNEQIEIVQFHQSYDYEDFVQGIRPRTDPDTKQIRYDVVDGIFLEMCQRAAADPDRTYVLIIDEINRGNVSRIFGELLMLLEYRGKRVRLPYGSSDGSEAQRYLRIPDNLILIGTMNSTDRSLAMIDYALRRRFFFYRMLPVVHGRAPVFERWLATQETLSPGDHRRLLERFIALNQEVSKEHSPDFQIGHSYFMQDEIGTETALRRIWTWSLRPLLQEYFHGSRETETLLAQFEQLVLGPPRHEATDDELSVGVEAMDGAQTARPESPDDV
jgi:MoxR-like ATPase